MKNEYASIDIDLDKFYDEGVAEAGDDLRKQMAEEGSAFQDAKGNIIPNADLQEADEEEAEAAPEVKDKAEEKEADSAIAKIFGVSEENKQDRVPLEDHIKLRKRAQAAEAKVAEYEAQRKTQTEEDKTGIDEFLEGLEGDDLVRADEVKKAIPKIVEHAVNQAVSKVNQGRQAEEFAVTALASEKEFMKNTPDYDKVTKAAIKLNFLTADDKQKILASDNPAKAVYDISKARLTDIQTTLGINPSISTGGKTTNEEPIEPDDEEVSEDDFLSVFNS